MHYFEIPSDDEFSVTIYDSVQFVLHTFEHFFLEMGVWWGCTVLYFLMLLPLLMLLLLLQLLS